jgi:hypothetical protein
LTGGVAVNELVAIAIALLNTRNFSFGGDGGREFGNGLINPNFSQENEKEDRKYVKIVL